jgi:hypothetical protein
MNLPSYSYSVNESFLTYEFFSDGPAGLIKKVVRFTRLISKDGSSFYNLAFGDWNETEQRVDDLIVTNNKDSERVLATVAAVVIDFSNRHKDVTIFAEGSTQARTRKYQMGIGKFKNEIESIFDVYGFGNKSKWEKFQTGINYEALLVRRKKQ